MEPTNRELKIILDNHQKRSDEKHDDLLGKLKEVSETMKVMALQNTEIVKLKDWSAETQRIVEALVVSSDDYKTNKTRLYTIVSIMLIIGGSVLALAVKNLKTFIKDEINTQVTEIR